MQYMLLIYEDEDAEQALSASESRKSVDDHIALARRLRQEGRFVTGDALQPAHTATCLRIEGGKAMITDGPYAETKEQLAGFYVVEAADLDQALADAAAIPSAARGTIEIRPLLDLSGA